MPYVDKDLRRVALLDGASTAGELNFLLTNLVRNYLMDNGMNYQTMNDIIGALEGCKMEFYRRMVVPYEDKKIEENGDVY
jgi:hypothetical protein